MDIIPPGLWYDEAIHGLDTLQITEQHQFPIFFNTENHPQEPMFSYIIAVFYKMFGVSAYTLRLTSAILGTITIILCYFLVKSWFDERMALLTTFLLAISKWHLIFSRLCLRTILTPLFCILVFYFLYDGLKKIQDTKMPIRRFANSFLLSGFFLGLGMYTYISFRLVPVLVFLFILHEWYHSTPKSKTLNFKSYFYGMVLFYATALVVFIPLLIDYIHNPFHFFGRTEEISPFQGGVSSGIQLIFWNTIKTIGMFSFVGDPEAKHNNPGEPMLPWGLSIFLLIGLIYTFRNWKKLKYLMTLSWFLFFLLPSIFSVGAPNTLRTLGGVPALCILIALGIRTTYDVLNEFTYKRFTIIINTGLTIILLYSTILVYYQYFYEWGRSPETAMHFNYNEYYLGQQIRQLSGRYDFYLPDVLANQEVIKFVSRPAKFYPYQNVDDLPSLNASPRPKVILYLNPTRYSVPDPDFVDKVIQRYPHVQPFKELKILGDVPWVLGAEVD